MCSYQINLIALHFMWCCSLPCYLLFLSYKKFGVAHWSLIHYESCFIFIIIIIFLIYLDNLHHFWKIMQMNWCMIHVFTLWIFWTDGLIHHLVIIVVAEPMTMEWVLHFLLKRNMEDFELNFISKMIRHMTYWIAWAWFGLSLLFILCDEWWVISILAHLNPNLWN